jgi:hypothetical protein
MDNVWLASALWIGLALVASVLSVWVAISVALTEIIVGAVAGNLFGLPLAPWVNFLAGFGAILLTFLAGAEIDPDVVRRKFWPSMSIGVVGFLAPYIGVLLFARYVVGCKRDIRCTLGESLRVDRNGAIRRAPIVAKRSCFRGQQVFWFGARSAKLNGIRSSISSSVGRRGNSARTWRSQS